MTPRIKYNPIIHYHPIFQNKSSRNFRKKLKLQYNIQGESKEQILKNSYLCMSGVTNLKNQIKPLNLCSDSTIATNRMPNKLENFNCTSTYSVKRLQSKISWNIYFKLSPMVQYNPLC